MRYISIKDTTTKKVHILNVTKAAVYIGVGRQHMYTLEKQGVEVEFREWVINFDIYLHIRKYT